MTLINSPAFKPDRFKKFEPIWDMLNKVWESLAFPEQMQEFLKRKPEEGHKDYNARLLFSAFENRYRPTITSNAALLSDFALTENVPESIRRFESDIDGNGTNLTTFIYLLAEMLLKHDSAFILVENSQATEVSTELELRLSGKRPSLKLVSVEGLQNGRLDEDGKISQIVFCHKAITPDGEYGEKEVKEYWRYRPGERAKFTIEEETQEPVALDQPVSYLDSAGNLLEQIPIVWVSASGNPPLTLGVPYFLPLAKLNIQHLTKVSELDDIEFKCNNPTPKRMWPGKKPQRPPKLVMGKVIECEHGGDVTFLEPSGVAIASTHSRNLDRELKMDRIGQAFLTGGEAQRTATEAKIDLQQSTLTLKGLGDIIESAIEEAFKVWTLYTGEAESGGIKFNEDAFRGEPDPATVNTVFEGVTNQIHSRRYGLLKLREIGYEPEGIDIDEELNQANLALVEDLN